jgi:hypothetical protein
MEIIRSRLAGYTMTEHLKMCWNRALGTWDVKQEIRMQHLFKISSDVVLGKLIMDSL